MFKKSLTAALSILLVTVGAGSGAAFASTQNQMNTLSAVHTQAVSGYVKPFQFQTTHKNLQQMQIGTNSASGQGQAGSVTSTQVQSGTTRGQAVFTQKDITQLNMTDKQKVKAYRQKQSIEAGDDLGQTLNIGGPSNVLQAEISHTAAIQSQIDISGGPKIQYQQIQRTGVQFQIALSK